MTDKSMFDILSKFDSAGSRTVNESAGATRSRSSSAGDPAMFDILSKFHDATVSEAGPGTYPSYGGMNTQMPADIANDEDLYKAVGDMQPEEEPEEPTAYEKEQEEVVAANEDASSDPVDTVTMDVPLLIRMLEFAREDASTDMDLHDVAEKLIALSANNGALTMSDYDAVVGGEAEQPEVSMEDVVSKDKRKGDDVVADKQAVDDIVQELSKSYADFVAQVEEERDDMSFFKKDKK